MEDDVGKEWDLFISHASEDKQAFVAPLATALTKFGIKVWYDEYELKLGDSLSRSIDAGLAESDYGLVILSKKFFEKRWPERELTGLVSREMMGRKIIIPVWHQVAFEDVLKYSPPLADKFAIRSDSMSVVELAVKIIETIRPELFTRIQTRIAYQKLIDNASISHVDTEKLVQSPIRHPILPDELIGRIRLVRASLLGAYTGSMNFWLDGFQRDAHPSQEVALWEHMAAVYQEYIFMTPEIRTAEDQAAVFHYIFALSLGDAGAPAQKSSKLPDTAAQRIRELYSGKRPAYDIAEGPHEHSPNSGQREASDLKNVGLEHFPHDLPSELISELVNRKKQEPTS